MNEQQLSKIRLYFTEFIIIVTCSTLMWQYFHEGVPSHHLLQRADLPAISNWWGALLLPALSWFLLGLVKKRITQPTNQLTFNRALTHFVIALGYGAILSLAFTLGYPEISGVLFPGILFFAIFFKVYREEFVLGFILSMSVTFGAVLPTIFAALIGLAAFVVHVSMQFIWKHIKNMVQSDKAY